MLQRSKSLAHVVELAERRVELARLRGVFAFVPRIQLAAGAQAKDEADRDEAESNQCGNDGVHGVNREILESTYRTQTQRAAGGGLNTSSF